MTKLKLVFLTPSMGTGGAERVMSILVDYFARKGWEVHLFIFSKEPSFYKISEDIHCHYIVPEKYGTGLLSTFRHMRASYLVAKSLIREIKPHCLIGFTTIINVLTIMLGKSVNIPSIISERTNPELFKVNRPVRLLRKFVYRFANAIVLQTERSALSFKRVGIKIPQKREVVFNPIRDEFTDLGLERQNIVISVGRLSPAKGHDLLLQAWAKAHTEGWTLVIAGDGESRTTLEKFAADLGITLQVSFAGKVQDVNRILNSAKVFVLPSRIEGFPNALCEAMVAGCACISFDCANGPAEIIQHGVNGYLVEAGNTDKLATAISELISNDAMQQQMSSKSVLLKKQLNEEAVGKKWDNLIKSLIVN